MSKKSTVKDSFPELIVPSSFESKGWGWEHVIVNKEKYCGKILFFKKDLFCSWHYHLQKDETFYIQSGRLKVYYSFDDCLENGQLSDDVNTIILEEGDGFHVPVGLRHRMEGLTDVYMFEFSTQHFDKDSIRVLKGC